jgi:hypothetical protein
LARVNHPPLLIPVGLPYLFVLHNPMMNCGRSPDELSTDPSSLYTFSLKEIIADNQAISSLSPNKKTC